MPDLSTIEKEGTHGSGEPCDEQDDSNFSVLAVNVCTHRTLLVIALTPILAVLLKQGPTNGQSE